MCHRLREPAITDTVAKRSIVHTWLAIPPSVPGRTMASDTTTLSGGRKGRFERRHTGILVSRVKLAQWMPWRTKNYCNTNFKLSCAAICQPYTYLQVVGDRLPSAHLDSLAGDEVREVVVQLVVAKAASVQRPDKQTTINIRFRNP